ncbi:MAG: glutathione S-transferase family protein [Inhella sp.]|nr:glutathione S-transferase family protein [Inhella sp.]
MSYHLYGAPATASLCVHWMLLELQQDFELTLLDLAAQQQRGAEYLRLNPGGRVPTLLVDGAPHSECAALLMLLAERHPEAGWAPAPGSSERADYLQWMVWLSNTLMPAFRAWFYPHEPAGAGHEAAVQAQARAAIEACWARLAGQLSDGRPYLLGSQPRAVDLLATMLVRWSRNMPRPAECWEPLATYSARMRQRPALQEVHRREGLSDWIDTGGRRVPDAA